MDPNIRLWRGLQLHRPAQFPYPPMRLFYARLPLAAAARVPRCSQPGSRKQRSLRHSWHAGCGLYRSVGPDVKGVLSRQK